jgi:hypothetical protein
MKNKKAFTILEIILVVGLFSILLIIPLLYTQTSQVRFDFYTQVSNLVSYIRQEHGNTVAGKYNMNHGVRLNAGNYVIFSGTSFNQSDSDNVVVDLPPTVIIRNVQLYGGGSDIIFSKPFGETTTYGSFELYSEQANLSMPIYISSFGTINY